MVMGLWSLGIAALLLATSASAWGLRRAPQPGSIWASLVWFLIVILLVASAGVWALLFTFQFLES
jgi:Mg2+ and Co2+ transporter CorA